MTEDDAVRNAPTRRDALKYGGTLIAGAGVAGCTGQSGSGSATDSGTATTGRETTTDGAETTTADDSQATETSGTYEACIEPAGCVSFAEVPETYIVYNGAWADMAFALGQREGFLTAGNMIPAFFFEPFGLDVPSADELSPLANWDGGGWSKEVFYELDPEVILMDPNYMHGTGWDGDWDQSDTEEIATNVAPFFGNNCRRRREFHDYKFYSLYGAFERLAALFQERERYEAFAKVHSKLQNEIQSRLPPNGERTTVGLINGGSNPAKGQFYPLHTQGEGYEMKPYRDLDVSSAFPKSMEGATIDYEKLLEIDPEIIVVHWGIGRTIDEDGFSASAFRKQYVEPMKEDGVGSQLTAVEEGNVYPGAFGEQGPIVNLLQTEMKAQQLYPEEFGEFDPEAFPEVSEQNRLFDRQRVRDIIAGDL
jgi:iron complex transport system substrate-binding protein